MLAGTELGPPFERPVDSDATSPPAGFVSLSQNKPSPAVDELTHRVEVPGVDCGLGQHVQDDLPEVVEPPVAEQLLGPQGGRGVGERVPDPVGQTRP